MSSRLVLIVLLTATLLVTLCACGRIIRPPEGGTGRERLIPSEPLVDKAYLAPGQTAELPTTIRIRLSIPRSALPIANATFDPDGDGEAVAATVQVYELEGVEGSRYGTFSFYFDYEWNGPDGTIATVVLTTANGEYDNANISLSLDWLPPWPY